MKLNFLNVDHTNFFPAMYPGYNVMTLIRQFKNQIETQPEDKDFNFGLWKSSFKGTQYEFLCLMTLPDFSSHAGKVVHIQGFIPDSVKLLKDISIYTCKIDDEIFIQGKNNALSNAFLELAFEMQVYSNLYSKQVKFSQRPELTSSIKNEFDTLSKKLNKFVDQCKNEAMDKTAIEDKRIFKQLQCQIDQYNDFFDFLDGKGSLRSKKQERIEQAILNIFQNQLIA